MGNDEKLDDIIKWLKEHRRKHVEAAEEFRKRVRNFDKRLLKRAYVANLMVYNPRVDEFRVANWLVRNLNNIGLGETLF